MKITVLGCGGSSGVPHPTLGWGNCDKNNPKNTRLRSSALVECEGVTVLLDASPDLRQQLFNLGYIPYIDAVLFTHIHYDHTSGLGELRPIFYHREDLVPVCGDKDVVEYLQNSFRFLFENKTGAHIYHPVVKPQVINGDFSIRGLKIKTFKMQHGVLDCIGYRINNFAYATDVKTFPDGELDKLRGLDVLIIDCLCYERVSSAHANLPQVLKWIDDIQPKITYLTHMDLSMDYDTLIRELPDNIRPAYDGLQIEI